MQINKWVSFLYGIRSLAVFFSAILRPCHLSSLHHLPMRYSYMKKNKYGKGEKIPKENSQIEWERKNWREKTVEFLPHGNRCCFCCTIVGKICFWIDARTTTISNENAKEKYEQRRPTFIIWNKNEIISTHIFARFFLSLTKVITVLNHSNTILGKFLFVQQFSSSVISIYFHLYSLYRIYIF